MVGVAWLFLLTLYFQEVRGQDPLVTGLLFAPMTVASLAGAAVAGRLAVRVGPRRTAGVGLLLVAGGLAAMGTAVARPAGLGAVLAGMVVGEAGFMLGSVALTIAATGSLEDRDSGLAAGLLNTATQLGGGIGLGIVATVVAAAAPADVTGSALRTGFLTCLAFTTLALLLTLTALHPPAADGSRGRRPAHRDQRGGPGR
jgi:MFS family permease